MPRGQLLLSRMCLKCHFIDFLVILLFFVHFFSVFPPLFQTLHSTSLMPLSNFENAWKNDACSLKDVPKVSFYWLSCDLAIFGALVFFMFPPLFRTLHSTWLMPLSIFENSWKRTIGLIKKSEVLYLLHCHSCIQSSLLVFLVFLFLLSWKLLFQLSSLKCQK